jgi:hypothetical protein
MAGWPYALEHHAMLRIFTPSRSCPMGFVPLLLLFMAGGPSFLAAQEKSQPVTSQRPVWKAFDELNKPFWEEQKTENCQAITVHGQEVVQRHSETLYLKWTPRQKGVDYWLVDYEIVGVKIDVRFGGNEIVYDSFEKNQVLSTDLGKGLLNTRHRLKIINDPIDGMKVTEVEDLGAPANKQPAGNQQAKPRLEQRFAKENLSAHFLLTKACFPRSEEEFKKGSWSYSAVWNVMHMGKFETAYTFTLNSSDKNKVDIAAKLKYSAPTLADPALPFAIKKGEMTSEKGSGTATLDTKAGRIAEASLQLHFKGTLTVDIAGMETEVELSQVRTMTVKSLDRDPTQGR